MPQSPLSVYERPSGLVPSSGASPRMRAHRARIELVETRAASRKAIVESRELMAAIDCHCEAIAATDSRASRNAAAAAAESVPCRRLLSRNRRP